MGLPSEPVSLSVHEIAELHRSLSTMRHNVNNHLSLIVAAVELLRRKPELGPRMAENIAVQPERIVNELRQFSEAFEKSLKFSQTF